MATRIALPPRLRQPCAVGLLACPFCREMFEEGEADKCPVCGMSLRPFESLPLSHDAANEDDVPPQPELEPMPLWYLGRGKGVLAALAAVGLGLFLLPWIRVTLPYVAAHSGW